MSSTVALDIVFDIEDELTDRSGFDHWWHSLDNDIREEVRTVMRNIVDANLERAAKLIKDANSQLDFISNEGN